MSEEIRDCRKRFKEFQKIKYTHAIWDYDDIHQIGWSSKSPHVHEYMKRTGKSFMKNKWPFQCPHQNLVLKFNMRRLRHEKCYNAKKDVKKKRNKKPQEDCSVV